MNASLAHRHFHDELTELTAKLVIMFGEVQDPLVPPSDPMPGGHPPARQPGTGVDPASRRSPRPSS